MVKWKNVWFNRSMTVIKLEWMSDTVTTNFWWISSTCQTLFLNLKWLTMWKKNYNMKNWVTYLIMKVTLRMTCTMNSIVSPQHNRKLVVATEFHCAYRTESWLYWRRKKKCKNHVKEKKTKKKYKITKTDTRHANNKKVLSFPEFGLTCFAEFYYYYQTKFQFITLNAMFRVPLGCIFKVSNVRIVFVVRWNLAN